MALTVDVELPRAEPTRDESDVLDAEARSSSTVPRGSPVVGRLGRVPSTPPSVETTVLLGVTGTGSAVGDAFTETEAIWPEALAVGRPSLLSAADAELQPAPSPKSGPSGAGNGTDGCAQLWGSVWEVPGALAVASWLPTAAGVSSPAPWAWAAVELPAEADEVPPTTVVPARVSFVPTPEALSEYGVLAAAPATWPPASPAIATSAAVAAPRCNGRFMVSPSRSWPGSAPGPSTPLTEGNGATRRRLSIGVEKNRCNRASVLGRRGRRAHRGTG